MPWGPGSSVRRSKTVQPECWILAQQGTGLFLEGHLAKVLELVVEAEVMAVGGEEGLDILLDPGAQTLLLP